MHKLAGNRCKPSSLFVLQTPPASSNKEHSQTCRVWHVGAQHGRQSVAAPEWQHCGARYVPGPSQLSDCPGRHDRIRDEAACCPSPRPSVGAGCLRCCGVCGHCSLGMALSLSLGPCPAQARRLQELDAPRLGSTAGLQGSGDHGAEGTRVGRLRRGEETTWRRGREAMNGMAFPSGLSATEGSFI
jgi:hypothetical protein